jgi:4-carboxymuconolactone decarboxylase
VRGIDDRTSVMKRTPAKNHTEEAAMARIPFATRNDIDEDERAAYDRFVAARSQQWANTGPTGPYALLLHMPELAQRLESLRLYLRDEASLPQPLQELVMITVAREMDCAYIWNAHASAARTAGIHGEIVDAIRDKRPLSGLSAEQQVAVDYARELLRTRRVSQITYDRTVSHFGRRGTLTLTNLVACYAMLAYNMNALELEAPWHPTEPPLPT